MRTIWRGTISFGLVSIPVGVVVAQDQPGGPRMRRVARASGAPVRHRRWDPVEDRPLDLDETVAGAEVAPGRFATVEADTLRALRAGPLPEPPHVPEGWNAPPEGPAPAVRAASAPEAGEVPSSWTEAEAEAQAADEAAPPAADPVADPLLERLAPEPHTVRVERFVRVADVPPELYDRAYWLAPQRSGARPYGLLHRALLGSGRAAVCRVVLRERERLALVRAADDLLVLHVLHWPEDVRTGDRARIAEAVAQTAGASADELEMARRLVQALEADWDPGAHRDAARARLRAHLEARAAEVAPSPASLTAAPAPPGDDLLAALRASLEAAAATG
jgi:DNA end-binding protein Ku